MPLRRQLGRDVRYRRLGTKLCIVDPENSAVFPGWCANDVDHMTGVGSRIDGVGRPRVEPSFLPEVVDRMISVPDAASVAAARFLQETTGWRAGGSTGTNMWGALRLVCEMHHAGERGSMVTLLRDGGDRYTGSIYDDTWVAEHQFDLGPPTETLRRAVGTGRRQA